MKICSKHLLLSISWLLVFISNTSAQDSSRLYNRMVDLPDKFLSGVDKKAARIDSKLASQTGMYLSRLQRIERKLKKKLMKKDSLLAMQMFREVDERYAQLKATSGKVNKYTEVYSGYLDSLRTGLRFLQSGKLPGLAGSAGIEGSLDRLNELQERFNQTDRIRKYLNERESLLKTHMSKLGMIKELKKFKKNVYYYQSQIREYKSMLEDPDKLQKKAMSIIQQSPQFQGFFKRNSQLAGLFALPGSSSDAGGTAAPAPGIQTNALMTQVLQERFGSNNPVVSNALQQAGKSTTQGNPLSILKDKVKGYSSGGVDNGGEMKETGGFKPNNQKTKSFWKRLEVGTNLQSQKARSFFPVTTDLGLSVGYKLNDKSVIGVGAAYKMGLGSGWNKIKLTHQGLGIRSYVDYKVKGALYITGGYEQNYRSGFSTIAQLKNYSGWQTSGLIGLSKRYAVGKKLKGEMKVLWDFLSYQQVPRNQPIIFRLGYNLK